MLRRLPRDSERSGALACATRTPAYSERPQLVRRTTAARRNETGPLSGQCPCLAYGPSTTSAARRAHSKFACYASSRETASAVARSRLPRKSGLVLGGRRWYVAPRPRVEGEGALVGTLSVSNAWADHNQRGTARAQQARVLRLLPRNSERSVALAHATRTPAGSGRPQLVRRTTAARRKREAFGRCNTLT